MNYCPKCGFEVKGMKYCPKCGFALSIEEEKDKSNQDCSYASNPGTYQEEPTVADESWEDELHLRRTQLIGPKADHYLPMFEYNEEKKSIEWNWCAFFLGPFWFAYRGLYAWACISLLTPMVIGFMCGLVLGDSHAGDLISKNTVASCCLSIW